MILMLRTSLLSKKFTRLGTLGTGQAAWLGRDWIKCSAMSFCSLALLNSCYVIKQGYHQNNLINAAIPIEKALLDNEMEGEKREKLELVSKVLSFARKNGLNVGSSYQYFVRTKNRPISFSLAVAPELDMKLKKWWFPIVGSVPYLGYFSKTERDREVLNYSKQNYDTHTSEVAAFSSLGWFPDPIFESYLKRSPQRLASLIFHELTHRTVWLPGNVRFNENFAEFCAIELSRNFFKKPSEAGTRKKTGDRMKFVNWLKSLKSELRELYSEKVDANLKLERKKQIIEKYQNEKIPQFANKGYIKLIKRPWNNASILARSLYIPDFEVFEQAMKCSHSMDIKNFIKKVSEQKNNIKDEATIEKVFCS